MRIENRFQLGQSIDIICFRSPYRSQKWFKVMLTLQHARSAAVWFRAKVETPATRWSICWRMWRAIILLNVVSFVIYYSVFLSQHNFCSLTQSVPEMCLRCVIELNVSLKEAHSTLLWRGWTTTECLSVMFRVHNKICVVDTENLCRRTFSSQKIHGGR